MYTFRDASSVVIELINARIRSLPLLRSPPGLREGATGLRCPTDALGGRGGALDRLPQRCGPRVGEVVGSECSARLAADCRSGRPTAEGPEVSGWPRWPPVVTTLSCKAACFRQGSAADTCDCRCECKSSVPLRDIARRHAGSDLLNEVTKTIGHDIRSQ